MNRMKVLLVVGSLTGVAACSTVTRSNAEFVRDLHIDGGHLVVETCRAEYAIDHHEGAKVAGIAAIILLIPIALALGGGGSLGGGGGGGGGPTASLGVSNCSVQRAAFPTEAVQ